MVIGLPGHPGPVTTRDGGSRREWKMSSVEEITVARVEVMFRNQYDTPEGAASSSLPTPRETERRRNAEARRKLEALREHKRLRGELREVWHSADGA